jgi:hypothetical protein
MHKSRIRASALFAAFLFTVCVPSNSSMATASDWGACASDLDDVHSASDDAADAAREAQEAQDDLESKRSDLTSCSDDCESERSEYDGAKSELEDKVSNLKSELSDLDSKIRSATDSCHYEMGSPTAAVTHRASTRPTPCSVYQRYRKRLPLNTIVKICTGSMSVSECKKCLGATK